MADTTSSGNVKDKDNSSKTNSCLICGKFFKSIKKVNIHKNKAHQNNNTSDNNSQNLESKCNLCNQIFKNKNGVKNIL